MKFRRLFIGILAATASISAPAFASGPQLLTDVAISIPGQAGFGGLSAIEMDRNGGGAVVVSDRAAMFTVSFSRNGGRVTGVGLRSARALTDASGNRPGSPDLMDSEGLARLPNGQLAISFEGRMRVAIHGNDGRERRHIAPPPGSGRLPGNGGYEGLAADSRGNLYTLAEQTPGNGPIPLYRFSGGSWQHFASLPRTGSFRPVGVDFDDRGRLYVLERRFSLGGFASRITRYNVGSNGIGGGEVVLSTPIGTHGNLEGLSVWRSGALAGF